MIPYTAKTGPAYRIADDHGSDQSQHPCIAALDHRELGVMAVAVQEPVHINSDDSAESIEDAHFDLVARKGEIGLAIHNRDWQTVLLVQIIESAHERDDREHGKRMQLA
jgi:hypothetical protein